MDGRRAQGEILILHTSSAKRKPNGRNWRGRNRERDNIEADSGLKSYLLLFIYIGN